MKLRNNLKTICKVFFLSCTVSMLIACATEKLNMEGNKVRITSSHPGKNCTFIRQISVTSNAAPGWWQNPTEDIYNKLRNRAADLRGNLIYIDSMGLNSMAGGAAIGSVYECK